MRPRHRRLLASSLCAAALALRTAPTAAAPADAPATDGAVFAGVTGTDPANLSTNPATLLRLVPGIHFFAFTTVAVDQVSIDRRVVSADDGSLAEGPAIDDATLGAGVAAGVAQVVARGIMVAGTIAVQPPDETIADDAVAYHTRGSRARRIDWFRLGAGLRVTSRLLLGFSFGLTDRHQRLAFARDTALEAGRDPARGVGSDCGGAPCGLENAQARELWTVDVTNDLGDITKNLTYTVGVMARLPEGVWLGLSLDRPVEVGSYAMDGDVTILRAPRDGGGILRGEARLIQRLPEVWRLGGRGPIAPSWELVGELRWRHLGRTDPLDLRVFGGALVGTEVPEWTLRPQGLRDAFTGELGVEPIDLGQRWRFGGRLGFDSGAVSTERLSARAPWGAQVSAALGAQVRLDRWVVQLGYKVDLQVPIAAVPGRFDPIDRIECVEADFDYDDPACATVRAGYGTPTAAGTYGRWSHTARVALRVLLQ